MNEIKIWESPEWGTIRTVNIGGEAWMVGKDVCEALKYSNPRDALATHVDADDKRIIQKSEIATFDIPNRGLTIINESGLYSLALSSKLPSAKRFRRWVTTEVLPSIYRHGAYMTEQKIEEVLLNPDTIINLAQQLKAEKEKTAKLAPAAEYAQNFLLASGGRLISSIAKDYGMSAQKFNQLLHKLGIQYRQGGQWLLYQKYTGKGYTETRVNLIPHNDGLTHQHPETLWTAKGCAFLAKQLGNVGIVPEKKGAEA